MPPRERSPSEQASLRARVERCAQQANASEFIAKFADGYETVVGERGVRLSGGPSKTLNPQPNTKGYSSTELATGFANVRAGTQKRRAVFGYPPEH